MKISKDLLKQMIAEEMANLGSVNEESTDPDCEEIRARYNKMSNKADEAFRDDWAIQSGIAPQLEAEARAYKEKHSECFEKEVPPAQPGKSGMDITKKQYGLEENLSESKKDMLKRIVAEEVVKMELEQLGKEGALEEIFGLFGDSKLKMIEKEIIPKFRKGLAKRRRHHQEVPSHYWHYVTAEAIRRAYNEYENTEYREATRKSKEWKKLGEEIDALVSDAYNLVKTNAMKSKTADAQDRKKMLSLDAYEADSGFKGTAKSYIP